MEWLDVFKWWIILELIGLSALPLCAYIFKDLDSRGLPLSKVLGLVLVTYFSWALAHLGFTYNSFALGLALLIVSGLSIATFYSNKGLFKDFFERNELFRTEVFFSAAFLIFAIIRGFSPDIYWSGGEKFMDMSFINIILRSTSFPPMDPWMSGEPMQYYYFGYLVVANLIRLSFVPSAIGFNLAVATMFALSASAAYGLGKDLTHSKGFGMITMAFVVLFGNLAGFVQLLVILFFPKYFSMFNVPDADIGTRLSTYFYWPASRVIPNTINEFPYFSFIHGDLHAHMISIVFQLLLVGLLVGMMRSGNTYNIPLLAVFSLVLGFMFPLNTWEYPTYAVFFLLALIALRIRITAGADKVSGFKKRMRSIPALELFKTAGVGAMVGTVSIVLYLPYHLSSTESHSIKLVPYGQSQLFFYLGVYGIVLFFIMIYTLASFSDSYHPDRKIVLIGLAIAIAAAYLTQIQILIILLPLIAISIYLLVNEDDPIIQFVYLCILMGALLSLFCELFYIQDSLGITSPKYIRLNTVFKIYLQNWIIWGLAAGVSFSHLWRRYVSSGTVNKGFAFISVFFLLTALCYPVFATFSRSDTVTGRPTLDGGAYFNQLHPNEYGAIMWLNNLTGTPVVMQSPGHLYELNSHVTAFTGLPTVMGWAGHEKNWRSDTTSIDERWNDAVTVFTSSNVDIVLTILEKYQVEYIYVGGVEEERYNGYEARQVFENNPVLFELVYYNPNVHIYNVVRPDD